MQKELRTNQVGCKVTKMNPEKDRKLTKRKKSIQKKKKMSPKRKELQTNQVGYKE